MIMAGLLGAGGTIAGSAISGEYNARQAGLNRSFQERMSNTSHQRGVADLKAAGLNPVLSAKYGGASTPAGSSASIQSPDITGGYNKTSIQAAQTKNIKSQTKLTDARTVSQKLENTKSRVMKKPYQYFDDSTGYIEKNARQLGRNFNNWKNRNKNKPDKGYKPSNHYKNFKGK